MTKAPTGNRREWVLAALQQYEGRLSRFALRLLGDRQSADDAVQHAFLRLCDQAPEQVDGCLARWLFTVCRNKAVDVLRARHRAEPLEGDPPGVASREPDPADAAEQHDLYCRLSRVVAQLPLGQRESLDLWTEGFAFREIAAITGRTEVNVRVLVHRALTTLRQHPLAQEHSLRSTNPLRQ